jgi:hypothetical protein
MSRQTGGSHETALVGWKNAKHGRGAPDHRRDALVTVSETPRPDNTGPVLVLVLLAIALLLVVAAGAGGQFSADGAFAPVQDPTPVRADDPDRGSLLEPALPFPTSSAPTPSEQPAPEPEPEGLTLPHGSDRIFDGRMLVAYYGTAGTGVLGVLGETSPDRAFDRLVRAAAPFTRNGKPAQPVFELIVTVADAHPGPGRDFSHDIDPGRVLPYIEAAHRLGALLVLDLQPGRTDFLTVARRWEWALKYPWVGLALDPEWRMRRHQVPGRVIGSVSAAEINRTSAWLDQLSAEHGLPQKLLLLHQFRSAMIRGRAGVARRPNLAIVQHVDGFGTPRQKLATFHAVADPQRFRMGFKLFYDEDVRRLSARRVKQIRPRVDFVSFQ